MSGQVHQVVAMAALMVLEQGWQVALMALTELLARQHADTVHKLLRPLGREKTVDLLVGSLTAGPKSQSQGGHQQWPGSIHHRCPGPDPGAGRHAQIGPNRR